MDANGKLVQLDFKTARGADIRVKKEAIDSIKSKLSDDYENPTQQTNQTNDAQFKINLPQVDSFQSDFQTANGRKLTVKKSQFELENEKLLQSKLDPIMETLNEDAPNLTSDFQTANGKKLTYNKQRLEVENEKIAGLNSIETNENTQHISADFQTANGKRLTFNKQQLSVQNEKLLGVENLATSTLDPILTSDFQTAGGKNLTFKKLLLDLESEKLKKIDPPLQIEQSETSNFLMSGFQTGIGKKLAYNKDLMEIESAKYDSSSEEVVIKPSEKTEVVKTFNPPAINVISRPSSTTSKPLADAKPFKKPKFIVKPKDTVIPNETKNESNEKSIRPVTISLKPNPVATSSKNSFNISLSEIDLQLQTEISGSCPTPIDLDEFHLFKPNLNGKKQIQYLSMNDVLVETIKNKVNSASEQEFEFKIIKPILNLAEIEVSYRAQKNNQIPGSPILIKPTQDNYEKKCQTALNELKKRLEIKKATSLTVAERSKSGYMYNEKTAAATSKTIKRLKLINFRLNTSYDFSIGKFNENTIDEFKFNIVEFEQLFGELKKNGFVATPDGGHLIPDSNNTLGIKEFFDCFLDSNGVDAKLVDFEWFKNHFKWIIWKLNSYDFKLKNADQARILNPLNVITQLKYRYDVEIGNAKRSCIKRVTEKDDTLMNKLVILFVSKIFHASSNMIYVELSDGWYPIKALCDAHLTSYIKSNRIKVGDKLAIFSAEMIGCPNDGCSPLEAPDQLFIKLSVNSTRKAKWFCKLGFVRPQRPLFTPVYSIKPNTTIGAIDTYVERIYPLLYVEKKEDGSKVFRNERQEEILSYKLESKKDNDRREDVENIETISKSTISNSTANVPNKPNKTSYQRDVSQLLKLRLVDVNKKNSQNITCVITIWQNAGELLNKINEGQRIKFFNLFSVIQKSTFQENTTNIYLNANRQTFYLFSKNPVNFELKTALNCPRVSYEYNDLYENRIKSVYNEVDVCGVILKHWENAYQNLVFMTNFSAPRANSIICINFPKNTEFYGFKEVLKFSQIVACLNLRWTRKKELLKYPCLFATELSVFTQKLNTCKFFSDHFKNLNELMRDSEKKIEIMNELLNTLEGDIRHCQTLQNARVTNENKNVLNNSSNSYRNSQIRLLEESAEKKIENIAKVAELPALVTKNGARFPGLINKSRAGNFHSPLIGRVSEPTMRHNQLKRRSDISDDLLRAKNIEDEDSYLCNQDLEALFKNSTTATTSTITANKDLNSSSVISCSNSSTSSTSSSSSSSSNNSISVKRVKKD